MGLAALLFSTLSVSKPAVAGPGVLNEKFMKAFYFAHGGSGNNSGLSENNAKTIADQDIMTIDPGTVIEKVYVIVDTAITGTTDIDIGDDDDADGYVDGSLSVTVGTPGMYGWNVKTSGAYLRVQTAGATDAGDIYVVPNAKYYSAAGKEIKLDATGASTAGKFRVIVEGTKHRL